MSYDIRLVDEKGETIYLPEKHNFTGGTYAIGGTKEAWLNVTYNYSEYFYRVFGEKGIRSIYGMKAKDSLPVLTGAAEKLADGRDTDYWKATEGNARHVILELAALAKLAPPDSIWAGD